MDAHLRDLRYFVAVAEELSFTRAAETLHVSQPALSKQIRALEAALKIRLLDRSRRQVQLTPAGIAVRETATRLLAEWDDGVAGARAVAQLDAQRLIVGTLTSLGRGLYPLVVDAYARVQPGWQIDLRSFRWTDSSAGLRDRETDAAFLWLPIDGDDVAFEVLFTEPVKVALAAGHRLATRTGIDIEELASESFVALPEIAGEPRDFWLGTDVTSPPRSRTVVEANSAEETFEIVSSGRAVALLAAGNALLYSHPGVVSIPVHGHGAAQLAVGWRRDDRREAVRNFVSVCLAASRELAQGASIAIGNT